MVLDTTLVNELLSCDISCGEEDSSRDALGEQRASSQLGVVPDDSELLLS